MTEEEKVIAIQRALEFDGQMFLMTQETDNRVPFNDYGLKKHTVALYDSKSHDRVA